MGTGQKEQCEVITYYLCGDGLSAEVSVCTVIPISILTAIVHWNKHKVLFLHKRI